MKPTDIPAGMEVRLVDYRVQDRWLRDKMRKDFDMAERRAFLVRLGRDERLAPLMRRAGMSERELACLGNGRCPPGYSVHHKLPVHGGGGNGFDNLVLIRDEPHRRIHAAMDAQIANLKEGETRRVGIPWPPGAFYTTPTAMAELAGGRRPDLGIKPQTRTPGRDDR